MSLDCRYLFLWKNAFDFSTNPSLETLDSHSSNLNLVRITVVLSSTWNADNITELFLVLKYYFIPSLDGYSIIYSYTYHPCQRSCLTTTQGTDSIWPIQQQGRLPKSTVHKLGSQHTNNPTLILSIHRKVLGKQSRS